MKHLKPILFLLALFLALFFFAERPAPNNRVLPIDSLPSLSKEHMHTDGFVPTETARTVVAKAKAFSFSPARLVDFTDCRLDAAPVFGTAGKLLTQDINRCQSVSRLLFPYHLFW
ncbi:hypothetical protein [Flavobacterium caeni]|uniref:Uncharacterized protein n=1 Tax=Flavobacterium caeni TaxID=490189 RepID=A0A1G5AY30_9FLAO|nr:hypothetical protein [Flavobacterium caeni]SCX82740.1 hypothetical protein SAMN02927903_00190 [Flavobacterium caeni]